MAANHFFFGSFVVGQQYRTLKFIVDDIWGGMGSWHPPMSLTQVSLANLLLSFASENAFQHMLDVQVLPLSWCSLVAIVGCAGPGPPSELSLGCRCSLSADSG